MTVLYEDNHLIIVNKAPGEIVQGDKTGDEPLSEMVKTFLKEKYHKPGNVFCGVTHRLDRPTSGVVVFAKTSKSLTRLNDMFRKGEVKKIYWAIVKNRPPADEDTLTHYLIKNEKTNKSAAFDTEKPHTKKAVLHYRQIAASTNYFLLRLIWRQDVITRYAASLQKLALPSKVTSSMAPNVPTPMGASVCMHVLFPLYILYRKSQFPLPLPCRRMHCGVPLNHQNKQDCHFRSCSFPWYL